MGEENVYISMIRGAGDHWGSLEITLAKFGVTYQKD